ncbi:response regulator receiver and ANTAR domain protein [Candidatus Ruthia magnifica str. Cm (Calyptogena magnifica)]|uniref:Response regulator receiver and ANTAR domain protein n=1 Tax=Ruthia magnifica subsp. Calyptogena magnifica TaxID=413404 RepID=A1AVV8_RUTMC|nr:response regulator receiver and ANTAR domain protein [Candidatus Ruthia magnifica str. Cm (Calyptogena magnifica)]
MLRKALQDKGHEVVCCMSDSSNLQDSNEMTYADMVIVNADIPDELVFANLTDINKTKPIVMFTEESNPGMASSAIKSGVHAYIVDGLEENRVQPIIDVAIARFREFQALKDELDATRNQLSERKAVEKAKGLLMQHKDVNEDEAYQSLRKMAMNKNKRIVDVAESVINAFELLE